MVSEILAKSGAFSAEHTPVGIVHLLATSPDGLSEGPRERTEATKVLYFYILIFRILFQVKSFLIGSVPDRGGIPDGYTATAVGPFFFLH